MDRWKKVLVFQNDGERGFTLIEVIVAIVILGLAYVAILQNFSVSLSSITRLDAKRRHIFQSLLDFERELRAGETEAADTAAGKLPEVGAGEMYIEGRLYNVVIISSEDGQFKTMKLEKK